MLNSGKMEKNNALSVHQKHMDALTMVRNQFTELSLELLNLKAEAESIVSLIADLKVNRKSVMQPVPVRNQ
jgi:hypothetical protein